MCRKYTKFLLNMYYSTESEEARISLESKIREVHEKIVEIYGLDVNRSGKFWEPYLKFESDILAYITATRDQGEEET